MLMQSIESTSVTDAYNEIVHKVHNKKMKKDKDKIKTQNKNTFKTTLNYYIRLPEYS